MNCTECRGLISAYLDGELEPQLLSKIKSHFASCSDCSHDAVSYQFCLHWLQKAFPEQAPPVGLWESIQAEARVGVAPAALPGARPPG